MKIINWYISSASKHFELSEDSRRFFSFFFIFLWVGGLIYVLAPIYEGLSAIPMYIESSRLEHDEAYLQSIEECEESNRKFNINKSIDSPITHDCGKRLTKYDAGLVNYSNQMSLRKSNSRGYIITSIIALTGYLFFCFLLPWSLIRGVIFIIKG